MNWESGGGRLVGVGAALIVAGILIGVYISQYLVGNTPSYSPPVKAGASPSVDLTIQTVAAVGPELAPNHPDWVSYLVRDSSGTWKRTTVWHVPAHATVHVTIYNFDGASGLRNPFFGRPTGLVGPELVDGKPLEAMKPDRSVAHVRGPRARGRRPGRACRRRRQEPLRLRAVRDVERPPDDHVLLQDRRARPLSLAVLRPLRRRVRLWLRRPDADDRLHGRVHQCRLSPPRAPPPAATPATAAAF